MNERIVIDNDELLDAIERGLRNKNIKSELWLEQNREDLKSEILSMIPFLVRSMGMTDSERIVTKPALEFKREEGTIRLYVYRAGQACHVGMHRQFHFGHDGTAGLVYDDQSRASGHQANDVDVDNASTWEWIQKWMTKGMLSEGIKLIDVPEHVQS